MLAAFSSLASVKASFSQRSDLQNDMPTKLTKHRWFRLLIINSTIPKPLNKADTKNQTSLQFHASFSFFSSCKKIFQKSRATARATETLIICSTFTWHFYASAGKPGNHRPAKHHPLGQISVQNHAESSSKLPYLLFRFKQHEQLSNTVEVAYSETLHLGELQHFTELTWSIWLVGLEHVPL